MEEGWRPLPEGSRMRACSWMAPGSGLPDEKRRRGIFGQPQERYLCSARSRVVRSGRVGKDGAKVKRVWQVIPIGFTAAGLKVLEGSVMHPQGCARRSGRAAASLCAATSVRVLRPFHGFARVERREAPL